MLTWDIPWTSQVAPVVGTCLSMQETWDAVSIPGWGRAPPVFVPGEPHGQRSLAGCSPWGRRRVGHAEELDTTEWLIIQHTGTLYWAIQQLGKQRNALITHEGMCIRMLIRMLILNLVQKTVSNLNAHKKGKIIQEIENNLSKKRTFKINKWMNTWNSTQVLKVGKR